MTDIQLDGDGIGQALAAVSMRQAVQTYGRLQAELRGRDVSRDREYQTTILDPELAPTDELTTLFTERCGSIETAFDEVKTTCEARATPYSGARDDCRGAVRIIQVSVIASGQSQRQT